MSSTALFPGPLRRLTRDRVRFVAIVLLGVVAFATAGIQAGAAAALRASLDANWRGLYDILVLPADAELPESHLPPNTLNDSAAGLTFDDLAAVRSVAGVEVAAPIGEIIVPQLKFDPPRITIPRELAESFDAPQAYRVSVVYTTDDGLGERFVSSSELSVVVDGTGSEREAPECQPPSGEYHFEDYLVEPDEYPAIVALFCHNQVYASDGVFQLRGGNGTAFTDAVDGAPLVLALDTATSPAGMTRIALVDPVAERALLGDGGAFLDELITLDTGDAPGTEEMLAWARSDDGGYGRNFLDWQARNAGFGVLDEAVLDDLRRLWAANGDDYDDWVAERAGLVSYLPLVVADAAIAPLSIRVTVTALGPISVGVDPEHPGFEIGDVPTGPGRLVGTTVADVSSALNPFLSGATVVGWPGTVAAELAQRDDFVTQQIYIVGQPIGATYTGAADAPRLEASGYIDPESVTAITPDTNPFALRTSGEPAGSEAAYTTVERLHVFRANALGAVPVGTFDPTSVGGADAVNYVPLGLYEPIASTIDAGEHAGAALAPSVSALGLVSPRTVAIAPIAAAAAWDQADPINAIRVRVGGIDGYTPSAQQRVVETAAAIESLGYRVVVVAGSSPTPVAVEVDGYAFGVSSPDERQTVGELGRVTQHWSEFGAAARADVAISTSSVALLVVALFASVLLLASAQIAAIPARRERAAVMRTQGFTRPRIARWIAGEELLGLAIVVVAGGAAVIFSGATMLALIAAGATVGTVLVTALAVTVIGSRDGRAVSRSRRRSNRLGARSASGFGVRQTAVHSLVALTHAMAIVLVGLAGAALTATFLQGRRVAGESLLATLLGNQLFVAQSSLAIAAVLAGIVLMLLGRRLDLARRAEQWNTLRAAGWTSRELARAQRVEGLVIAVPSVLIAAGIACLAVMLDLPDPVLLVSIAAAASTAAAVIAFSPRRKGIRT